jgi:hypothetical protein
VYDKRLVTDKMVQHWNMWRIFTVKNGPKTLSMLQIKPADWLFSAPLPPAAERWNTEDGGASRTGSGLGRLGARSAGWWLRLIYCERKILLAGWWLVAGAELV